MYLSAERIAAANQAIQETFEQTSVAWQAIPHWDIGDPGQIRVINDLIGGSGGLPEIPDIENPLIGTALDLDYQTVRFFVTIGQAMCTHSGRTTGGSH